MQASRTSTSFGPLQLGIIILTIATAAIHFYLNVLMGKLDLLFTLNGLGYLALLAALFLPLPFISRYRNLVRWALIAFTLVTILAWLVLGARDWLGYIDKLIEVALVVLLFRYRPRG